MGEKNMKKRKLHNFTITNTNISSKFVKKLSNAIEKNRI